MHSRTTKVRLLQVGMKMSALQAGVKEVLSAEPLLSRRALVTGGLVQQDKESNSWKMQDRKNQSALVTGQGLVM